MRKAQGGSIAPGVLLEDALEHQDELRRQGFEQMKKRFELQDRYPIQTPAELWAAHGGH